MATAVSSVGVANGQKTSWSAGPERRRLCAAVEVAAAALGRSKLDQADRDAAATLLGLAREQAFSLMGDLDSGWKYLHEAERLFIATWTPAECENARVALLAEAKSKLSNWRKDSIVELLEAKDGAAPGDLQERLARSYQIRDEHSDNVYFRNRVLRQQMGIIMVAMVALGFIAWVAYQGAATSGPELLSPALKPIPVLAACVLGAMGACLSALVGFSSTSADRKIPEHLANVWITLTRPMIGAVSGLVGLLAMVTMGSPTSSMWLIATFAFGFSERLVIDALNKASKGLAL